MIIVGKEEVTVKNELYEKWDDILENMKTEFEISALSIALSLKP